MEKNNLQKNIQKELDQEKDVILVWLDFGPYSYINLAIISELNKLKKFDFIGIVTTQQDLSFFQNQKFITFKKLYYYPKCYIGKTTYNLENLKRYENEFGLYLWLDIFSERSFYRFWTHFHKFTREEILIIIENSIEFFINILEKYKPKKILMQQAGENVSNLLLYRIAKKIDIETLMPINLHLRNRIHISNNFTSNEISEIFLKAKTKYVNQAKKYDKEFLKASDHTVTLKTVADFDSSIPTFSKKIKHYIRRLSNELEPTYNNRGKTKSNMLIYRIKNYFEIKKRKLFLDNNSSKIIKDEKFFYFPLQSEPEATILAFSPFFSNQIALIETIVKAIPIDSILYVKEHPTQKEKFWRSVKDYQKILDIPNVKLIHPDVNSLKVVEKSQGIICISGSTGFEALFYKKPVIIFGDEHYEKLSMVTKISNISNLSQEIKSAIDNFEFNENELNIFIRTLNECSLSIPYASIMKEGVFLSSIQRNGENFNVTNTYFQKFVKRYETEFKLISKEILTRFSETSQ
ncbi:hypothetical protein NZNM25_19710 [Nitrosopumilus zosterae]|uniref:Capsule polysaccharide biosynthesis protein n=1 Tax=Nitrosopumilus zosterae TaxID=718286 RepID=A0A2S2KU35_9ARCH|nr:hypothetical protein [Nitrosopumilus zosterae]BDQ31830.1 capsular biosynthesis protein [Nitrosopumilus zosterae]GBH35180.1 hypothetical protein NZNM25_19710 [Nitrosopumilus zosterae]